MRLLSIAIAAVACLPTALEARPWTDDSRQHRREAEYPVQHDGKVWLKDDRGKTCAASPEQELRAAEPGSNVKTRAHRIPTFGRASGTARPSPAPWVVDAKIAKLAGWHCYSGLCYGGLGRVSHAPPRHPCPPPQDKGKRILKGYHSTFHLVARTKEAVARTKEAVARTKEADGTGAYKFADQDGCDHEYLELLQLVTRKKNNDRFYKVIDSTPGLRVTDWQFRWVVGLQEWYWVFYSSNGGQTWTYYDFANATIVE